MQDPINNSVSSIVPLVNHNHRATDATDEEAHQERLAQCGPDGCRRMAHSIQVASACGIREPISVERFAYLCGAL